MPTSDAVVIADASPLVHLDRIGRLDLLPAPCHPAEVAMSRFLALVATLTLAACQPRFAELKPENAPPFVQHDNEAEATSGRIGYLLGSIIGIPISVVCLPVTIPLNSGNTDPQSAISLLAPMHYSGVALGTVTGIATWPLFGWYTFDDQSHPTSDTNRSPP